MENIDYNKMDKIKKENITWKDVEKELKSFFYNLGKTINKKFGEKKRKKITSLEDLTTKNIGSSLLIYANNKFGKYCGTAKYISKDDVDIFSIDNYLTVSGKIENMTISNNRILNIKNAFFVLSNEECDPSKFVYIGPSQKKGIIPEKYIKLLKIKN